MNDMYRERFPNAISQMEEKLLEFISNNGVLTPSATSAAISTSNSASSISSNQNHPASQQNQTTQVSNCSSSEVTTQTLESTTNNDYQLSTPRVTPKSPGAAGITGLPSDGPGGVVTPTSIAATPVSDPVVSFVSHQIMELARDCLEKSTDKNLTGAYFNELCIKVCQLLNCIAYYSSTPNEKQTKSQALISFEVECEVVVFWNCLKLKLRLSSLQLLWFVFKVCA